VFELCGKTNAARLPESKSSPPRSCISL